jgi:hypothetical protein
MIMTWISSPCFRTSVGDVKETVHAVEVDERTEVGDVLDHALADLTGLDGVEELATLLAALLLDELAAGEDDVLAQLVDLDDLKVVGLADVLIQVLGRLDVHVRGRDEGIDTDGDDEAALDLGLDATGGDGALGELGEDVIPVLLLLGLVVGEDRIALLVFDLLDQHLDGAADLELADVDKLVGGNDALGFAADIDDDFVLADFGDDTGDDFALLELAEVGTGQQLLHDGTHNLRGACRRRSAPETPSNRWRLLRSAG